MARPVLTKQDFVRRYAAGEFGNGPPTWETLDQCLASGYRLPLHIRNRIKGGPTWYDIPAALLEARWWRLTEHEGIDPHDLYISGMGPERLKLFQGETEIGIWGRHLHFNVEALPMKEVQPEDWFDTNGANALYLLRSHLDARSFEWLEYLLQEYPGHVVEFSTYSVEWGSMPGYNTVFWEVRRY